MAASQSRGCVMESKAFNADVAGPSPATLPVAIELSRSSWLAAVLVQGAQRAS
ncbi:MAG: hypothetical protein JWL84_3845 [Rhodospirillales bacterium]|nr:hypothetical protein [Rhodospirillales bacterium]